MFRSLILICAALCIGMIPAVSQEQTPPVMPKVQQTPLPAPVELPAPQQIPADVPNRPLTADEAAAIALHHQPNIAVAIGGMVSAEGRTQAARSQLLPSFSVNAGYTHLNVNPLGTTGAGSVPTVTGSGNQLSATISQLIFDFNHTRDLVQQSVARERAAGANLTKVGSDLVFQIKQAFYTYGQNLRLVAVNEANVRNQQSHQALAQARLNTGLGLPADVVRAETAVASAVFSLNLAQNAASISRTVLTQLMGIDPRTPVQVSDTGETPIAANDVQALINAALSQRPEIMQARSNVQAAAYSLSAAKTTNSPSLGANVGWLQRGTDFPPSNNSLSLGVSVQWTPFDSGLTAGIVKDARGNLIAAQANLDNAKLSVMTDVSQAYLNLKTAQQRVTTAQSEVANAEESVRLVDGRYRSGLGTFLDVLDAQTALVTANSNLVNARSAVDQANAALSHALGAPGLLQTMPRKA